MADKKKVVNKFVGMSAEELQYQKDIAEHSIATFEETIKRLQAEYKQEIKKWQDAIKSYKQNLELIEEASKHTKVIQYMTIIEVERKVKNEFIGTGTPKSYYSASDWKEKVYYTYTVLTCNTQNHKMARNCIFSSKEYSMTERQDILKDIIADIKKYNVIGLVLGKGVKLSKATLQKYCKDIFSVD